MELVVVDGSVKPENLDARCIVKMDGSTIVSTDFVAVFFNETEPVQLFAQASILSISVAMEVLKNFFIECYEKMPTEDQENFLNVLNKIRGLPKDEQGGSKDSE